MKKIIVIVLIIVVIIIYVKYLIITDNISIIQINREELNIEKLRLKEPIVIIDKIGKEYIREKFINEEIKKKEIKKIWERAESKYIIIYSKEDINIYICKNKEIRKREPNNKDDIIEIKLKKDRSIILPYMWYYSIEDKEKVLVYEIDDIVTKLLKYII
jgi:hypothetical protein